MTVLDELHTALAATVAERAAADAVLIAVPGAGATAVASGSHGLGDACTDVLLAALERVAAFAGGPLPPVAPLADLDPAAAAAVAQAGLPGALCAPLDLDDARVGVLVALCRRGDRPDPGLVLPIARHAAVAVAQDQQVGPPSAPDVLEINDEFDRIVLATTSDEDLSRRLSAGLGRILGVPMTALMIYDDARDVLWMAPGSFGASDERNASYQISSLDPHSNSARVFATGQPYLSNDAVADPGIRPGYVRAFGIRRLLSVPLSVGDRRIGVLHLANKEQEFTFDDLARVEALAPRVATVVELSRTSLRLRREQSLERVLARMALAIASGGSLPSVLPPALEALLDLTEAGAVALAFDERPPVVRRRAGANPELERRMLEAAAAGGPARSDVTAPTGVGDPGWAAYHVPVHLDRMRLGSLSAFRARGVPFAEDERRALRRVAELAALALAHERYQQQAAQMARMQERDEISTVLHDDVQQLLTQAQSTLDATLRAAGEDDPSAPGLLRARRLVIRGFTALRSVTRESARPAVCDLPLRLRSALSSVEEEFGLPIRFDVAADAADVARTVPAAPADTLVKVVREALVNAAKHGGGCRAEVGLRLGDDGGLELMVADDGVGLGASAPTVRHGLASLRRALAEHHGRLDIGPREGGGTVLRATVPR